MATPVIPFENPRRRTQVAEAFEQERGGRLPSSQARIGLTLNLGRKLISRLAEDFRTGRLAFSPLKGRTDKDAGLKEIALWRPGIKDVLSNYLLGFSLSYEHARTQGPIYNIRVRIFSQATLRFGKSEDTYRRLVVEIADQLASYFNSESFKELLAQEGYVPRNYTGDDFVESYELSAHPTIRQEVSTKGDKNCDELLRIGDSIRNAEDANSIGTLTLFVRWNDQNCILGAGHVIARCGGVATIGTDVLWARGGNEPRKPVGPYVHPAVLTFADEQPAPLDAAIARINPEFRVEGNVFRRPGRGKRTISVTGFGQIAPTAQNCRPPVKIVGRGQRQVDAEIVGINAAFASVGITGDLYFYEGLLEIRQRAANSTLPREKSILTLGGDLGAGLYVVSEDGSTADFVGIVVGGNGKGGAIGLAYAVDAGSVFAALQLGMRPVP